MDTKIINKQWHPKPRVKIRRKEMCNIDDTTADCPFDVYQLFKKGLVGKRTTWLYNSDITLEQAIASYCDFKSLLDKYPTISHGGDQEGHDVSDQFERICLLHHYLNVLKIPQSKVEDAIKAGDLALCIV